jgi:hypothetical protein
MYSFRPLSELTYDFSNELVEFSYDGTELYVTESSDYIRRYSILDGLEYIGYLPGFEDPGGITPPSNPIDQIVVTEDYIGVTRGCQISVYDYDGNRVFIDGSDQYVYGFGIITRDSVDYVLKLFHVPAEGLRLSVYRISDGVEVDTRVIYFNPLQFENIEVGILQANNEYIFFTWASDANNRTLVYSITYYDIIEYTKILDEWLASTSTRAMSRSDESTMYLLRAASASSPANIIINEFIYDPDVSGGTWVSNESFEGSLNYTEDISDFESVYGGTGFVLTNPMDSFSKYLNNPIDRSFRSLFPRSNVYSMSSVKKSRDNKFIAMVNSDESKLYLIYIGESYLSNPTIELTNSNGNIELTNELNEIKLEVDKLTSVVLR